MVMEVIPLHSKVNVMLRCKPSRILLSTGLAHALSWGFCFLSCVGVPCLAAWTLTPFAQAAEPANGAVLPVEQADEDPQTRPRDTQEKKPNTETKASEALATEKVETRPRELFSGKNLEGWEITRQHVFDRHGEVLVQQGNIVLEAGNPATGIRWNGAVPKSNYELKLEAKRIDGSDFFCGLTFPVGDEYCTFVVGGWGGGTTGLSNIDDLAAIENETTDFIQFQKEKWYAIRLRVTDERITAWIDDKQMLDVPREGKKFSIWWEQEPLRPLGIATWYTKAAIRNIRLEELSDQAS